MVGVSAARGFAFAALVSLISSACGETRIPETIVVGASSSLEARRVTAAIVKPTRELLRVMTTNNVLVTTPDHPFAKLDEGWVPAAALSAGSRLVSEAAPGGTARVTAVEHLELREPTLVYNLTVARTHAYFVGTDALLVHNVDCSREGPSKYEEQLREIERKSQLLASEPSLRERERERKQKEEQLARERREYQEGIRKLLKERRQATLSAERQSRRLVLNDTTGRLGRTNCGYCTLAGLSDVDKLSTFVRQTGADESVFLKPTEIFKSLRKLGLASNLTPKPAQFKNAELQQLLPGEPPTPRETQLRRERQPEREAQNLMHESSANTFAVAYYYNERVESPPGSGHFTTKRGGHALTAVRRDDGSISFIDFQSTPPKLHVSLPDMAWSVTVIATDVDWRFNRQLYAAVRDAPIGRYPSL
jgi:hypothetical protein